MYKEYFPTWCMNNQSLYPRNVWGGIKINPGFFLSYFLKGMGVDEMKILTLAKISQIIGSISKGEIKSLRGAGQPLSPSSKDRLTG